MPLPRLHANHISIGGCHCQCLRLSIAADHEAYRTSHRHIAQHPPQLILALNQLPVHLKNHIVHPHPGLARWPIVVQIGDLRSVGVFQLQHPNLVLAYVAHFDPEIPLLDRMSMRLTHCSSKHWLPERYSRLCRMQYLSSIQNSYSRHQRHDPERSAVFHLHNLNQLFF
jgi:hypothetical protein